HGSSGKFPAPGGHPRLRGRPLSRGVAPRSDSAPVACGPPAPRQEESPVRALTVIPLQAGSARLEDVPDPTPGQGNVLVQTVLIGVCGTDLEIVSGQYGWPPPGETRLVL